MKPACQPKEQRTPTATTRTGTSSPTPTNAPNTPRDKSRKYGDSPAPNNSPRSGKAHSTSRNRARTSCGSKQSTTSPTDPTSTSTPKATNGAKSPGTPRAQPATGTSPNRSVWQTGLSKITSEVCKRKHIKLVLSVRTGYEKLVFEEKMIERLNSGELLRITHHGFQDDSVVAIKEFLNFHNIPFSPSELLNYEMTNPLFLTLSSRSSTRVCWASAIAIQTRCR